LKATATLLEINDLIGNCPICDLTQIAIADEQQNNSNQENKK
jgi:hypothetical protein